MFRNGQTKSLRKRWPLIPEDGLPRKRHFPPVATTPWGIEIQGPSTFLKYQYDLNPSVVVDKLHAQAHNLSRTLAEQLAVLRPAAPAFVEAICQDLGIDIAP